MKTVLFDYRLPRSRIAQEPVRPRDRSKLLVYDRETNEIIHDRFYNLGEYLNAGDVLVFNNTKVFPARLWARRETGGRNEVFLLTPHAGKTWEALIGGKVRRLGMRLSFGGGVVCDAVERRSGGVWLVRFNIHPRAVYAFAQRAGEAPTPPYIKERSSRSDYQTVYAERVGSVAAPTAGFHFTKRLLNTLKKKGVQFEFITLHVGYGTFQPVRVEDIVKHKMHAEYAEVNQRTLRRLVQARREGRRIIAVGTTSVRALETVFSKKGSRQALAYPRWEFRGWINTFIYPGYKFKFVDAMITNFHVPKSTLLMLAAAFIQRRGMQAPPTQGIKMTKRIYNIAIRKKYRFYSFGDGMLVI